MCLDPAQQFVSDIHSSGICLFTFVMNLERKKLQLTAADFQVGAFCERL